MTPPATEYFKKSPKSVSKPEAKSNIIEATVEKAYNSGDTASVSLNKGKSPSENPGRGMPPKA